MTLRRMWPTRIADELASCGVKLVASLPDNWLIGVIEAIDRDERFVHVPVNREESAVGLCSGAYMGAMGSAALMGASGLHDGDLCHHQDQLHLRNPAFSDADLRGAGGDHHKHHISNGLYLRPVLDAINMPYQVIDDPGEIGLISRSYHHTRTFLPPDGGAVHPRSAAGAAHEILDAFRTLAKHRNGEIVVTSAGNSGQAWWAATRDTEATFYLDASMSLATMFSSGLALARPELKIWAFMGDGAFCMNPGMLMVERQMNLPNLTHILVSNRVYGATSNAELPNFKDNDYAAIARAMGLERVFEFRDIDALDRDFAGVAAGNRSGHTFVVLEVEPFSECGAKARTAAV